MTPHTLSPLRRRELAQDKRRLLGDHSVLDGTEPRFRAIGEWSERKNIRRGNIILCAAALGRKRGALPYDLRDRQAATFMSHDGEFCHVEFRPERGETVTIVVRHLTWRAAPPICVETKTPSNARRVA